jgi:DNA-binding MarR family transcriptional regulator
MPEGQKKSQRSVKAAELNDNILWLLKQAFHFSLNTVNDALSVHGVTTAQMGLLRQLANEPGLSGADLARRLLISPQGVQLALTALERKQDAQHGRILRAYLTHQGRTVTSGALADAIAAHEKVFGVLSRAEQRQLNGLLTRVVEQGTGHTLFADHTDPRPGESST